MADDSLWQYGAAIDIAYANAFQSSDEMFWRSKATNMRLNSFAPNMGMFYLRRLVDENSRWGFELGAQAGYDTDGQVPSEQRIPGHSILRYLSRANVSYLAPEGKGLTLTAGVMNSFIGGPWSVALRPEIYWDGDGRLTGSRQLIKAVTTTLEYKIPLGLASVALRTEYRFDDSSGKQGGLFRSRDSNAGLVGDQHLLLFSCLLTFDKQ